MSKYRSSFAPNVTYQWLTPSLFLPTRSLHRDTNPIYKILGVLKYVLFQSLESLVGESLAHDPPLPSMLCLVRGKKCTDGVRRDAEALVEHALLNVGTMGIDDLQGRWVVYRQSVWRESDDSPIFPVELIQQNMLITNICMVQIV